MRTIDEIRAEIEAVQKAGRRINSLQNEGGEGYDHTDEARLTALANELVAVKYATEWSRENTIARKAEWNAIATRIGAKTMTDAKRVEREAGYTMGELKAAIAHHKV